MVTAGRGRRSRHSGSGERAYPLHAAHVRRALSRAVVAARWKSANASTRRCSRVPAALRLRRERWTTPDGDFVDIDLNYGAGDARAPLVVLFHGLEGSSRSHYALALMRALARRGWRGAVAHFRGCSGELNRLPRAYHSGDSAEIDWMLRRFRDRDGRRAAVRGGRVAGRQRAAQVARRAGRGGMRGGCGGGCGVGARWISWSRGMRSAVVSTACTPALFLATLRRKSTAKLAQYPGLYDRDAVLRARTLREFDDVVTAPLHGFRDTDDYWTRSSSRPWLSRIARANPAHQRAQRPVSSGPCAAVVFGRVG